MCAVQTMDEHFSKVASNYRQVRTTDMDPITFISETLNRWAEIQAADIDQLIEKVNARHYSTFSLYEEDDLDKTVKTFQKNVTDQFQNTDQIEWFDENILLVLKPK